MLQPIPVVGDLAKWGLDHGVLPVVVCKWFQDKKHLPLRKEHWLLYWIIHLKYWTCFRDLPNLVDCRDYNDRVQWLKLFDQDRDIIRCSDKLASREYVRQRVGSEHLAEVYQVADSFDELDFEALPDRFVLKTNHESGNVVMVPSKQSLDRDQVREKLERGLRRRYGWKNGEWHYRFIKPKIYAEEWLGTDEELPPPDYKFHCVNGQVRCLHFFYDRFDNPKEVTVTPEGEILPLHICAKMEPSVKFDLPPQWEQLLEVASKLSQGWKYVRVDIYLVEENIYFGEMTFYPGYGGYTRPGQKVLGELIDFDRTTFKPPVLDGARLKEPEETQAK